MRVEDVVIVSASGRHVISTEIADSQALKSRGLMFRQSLDPQKGMIFFSDPPRETAMWMRNTYISLDMLFILKDGLIHRIAERTEPFSETRIPSHGVVAAVLELAAGSARRMQLKVGDKVEHSFFAK